MCPSSSHPAFVRLVYAGVGWLCFREKPALQQELTFTVDYLGGSQSSM